MTGSTDEQCFTVTRAELLDALTHLQASVPWPPPIQRDGTIAINAESMADAILAGLAPAGDQVTVSRADLRWVVPAVAQFINVMPQETREAVSRLSAAASDPQ